MASNIEVTLMMDNDPVSIWYDCIWYGVGEGKLEGGKGGSGNLVNKLV